MSLSMIKAKRVKNPLKVAAAKGNKKGVEALKPYRFQKGQSGNPAGRPKGTGNIVLSDAYKHILKQPCPPDVCRKLKLSVSDGLTVAEALAWQVLRRSIGMIDNDGLCFAAVTELREVTEGKVPERGEFSGPNGAPLPTVPPVFNLKFGKGDFDDEESSEIK
jgi:hypothetical protein